jgi:hypothetical protein
MIASHQGQGLKMRALADATIAAIPERREAAPGRLAGMAYTLSHDEIRARVSGITAESFEIGADWLRSTVSESELPMPAEHLVRVIYALIAMFAEEKPVLLPLPLEPFGCYEYGKRTVHLDGCVGVEAAFYTAPPGWIGRRVHVQWDGLQVRLLDPKTGQLLREHLRQKRGWHRIKQEDRPPRTPLSTSQLLGRAGRAGSHIGALCEAIHTRQGQVGVRRIQGVPFTGQEVKSLLATPHRMSAKP